MSKPEVKIKNVQGIAEAMTGMRYQTKTTGDSRADYEWDEVGDKDLKLANTLIDKGDEHAKHQRGIVVWLEINMPRYIWSELDTYTVGVIPISSESTMYTLGKEVKRGQISENMHEDAPVEILEYFTEYANKYSYSPQLLKMGLPEAWMQKRSRAFTYQTLRRLYFQRRNHRLPEWQVFVEAIKKLPYADQFITRELTYEEELELLKSKHGIS